MEDQVGAMLEYIVYFVCSPRPPLPLSATLTELEAAIIVQSHARGFLVSVSGHLLCPYYVVNICVLNNM